MPSGCLRPGSLRARECRRKNPLSAPANLEQQVLKRFWEEYFPSTKPRVVTWNGKGFDMPVLRARSMIYGINAEMWYLPGSRWDSYTQRFAPDWHCDLLEQLSDYRACTAMGLNDMAH